jgi:menaquinone-dependent protoporphyrinogen IX oxidase
MKHIAEKEGGSTDTSRDHEYTDWARLDALAAELVASARVAS